MSCTTDLRVGLEGAECWTAPTTVNRAKRGELGGTGGPASERSATRSVNDGRACSPGTRTAGRSPRIEASGSRPARGGFQGGRHPVAADGPIRTLPGRRGRVTVGVIRFRVTYVFTLTEALLKPLKRPKLGGKIAFISAVAERLVQRSPESVGTNDTTPLSGESGRSQKASSYCGFWG